MNSETLDTDFDGAIPIRTGDARAQAGQARQDVGIRMPEWIASADGYHRLHGPHGGEERIRAGTPAAMMTNHQNIAGDVPLGHFQQAHLAESRQVTDQ
jgi:hypothetical protein